MTSSEPDIGLMPRLTFTACSEHDAARRHPTERQDRRSLLDDSQIMSRRRFLVLSASGITFSVAVLNTDGGNSVLASQEDGEWFIAEVLSGDEHRSASVTTVSQTYSPQRVDAQLDGFPDNWVPVAGDLVVLELRSSRVYPYVVAEALADGGTLFRARNVDAAHEREIARYS